MHIGIDLDDTLISITKNGTSWRIKDSAREYLIHLARTHELHLISDRVGTSSDTKDISIICKQLSINGIEIKSITYTGGNPKGKIAAQLGCKYMVDDNEELLSDCIDNGVVPIHLKLKGKKKFNRSTDTWKEANSWKEVYEFINNLDDKNAHRH